MGGQDFPERVAGCGRNMQRPASGVAIKAPQRFTFCFFSNFFNYTNDLEEFYRISLKSWRNDHPIPRAEFFSAH